jgi:serine protease Do
LPGDVVIAINGVSVRTSSELTREVAKAKPGDALRLDVIHDGKRKTVEVRSGVRPSEKDLASNDNTPADVRAQAAPRRPRCRRRR